MKKRIVKEFLILWILIIATMSACTNKIDGLLEEAKTEFDKGDYQKVLDMLESEKNDDKVKELYEQATVKVLIQEADEKYKDNQYEEVMSILEDYKDNEEVAEIYNKANAQKKILEANNSYESGDYSNAVSILEEIKDTDEAKELYRNAKFKCYSRQLKDIFRESDKTLIISLFDEIYQYYENDSIEKCSELEEQFKQDMDSFILDATKYEEITRWEEVSETIRKDKIGRISTISDIIDKTIELNGTTKLKLALDGVWIRDEESFAKGFRINVSFRGDEGSANLTKIVPNDFGFEKGDLKWKEITLYDDKSFEFQNLVRSYYYDYDYWGNPIYVNYTHYYEEASAELDYSTMTIRVHSTNSVDTVGDNQIWRKKVDNSNDNKVKDKAAEKLDNAGDYIFPNSDKEYLDKKDVKKKSAEDLRLARNEIFARHGYIFKAEDLQQYFNSKSWYTGTIAADDFDDKVFNKYEKANIKLIKKYE